MKGIILLLAGVCLVLVGVPTAQGGVTFVYEASTGNMYVNTDTLSGDDGVYSMIIPGPEALSTNPTADSLTTPVSWQGGYWVQDYFDGKEQWAEYLGLVNLNTNGGELLIAEYATGLDLSAFGTVEYGAEIGGVNGTYYTGVTPEPATMSLLAVGAWTLLRRKRT